MKRLILIQNDYSGAGKTTLSRCIHRYLESYQVPHHLVHLTETADLADSAVQIEAAQLQSSLLFDQLEASDLVVMEIDTGLAQHFNKFSEKESLPEALSAIGVAITVVLPVTSEPESFDGVMDAGDVFSDFAQYLIVHTPSSTMYDEDTKQWERSRAARLMDMFEAVDLEMPSPGEALAETLLTRHVDLSETLATQGSDADPDFQKELTKWMRRAACQLDTVRKYAFGDAFRPGVIPAEPVEKRKSRSRAQAIAA